MLKKTFFPAVFVVLICLASFQTASAESQCFGTTSNGRLENGVQLPTKGKNFTSYSNLAVALGRTYVHSIVKEIIVEAYKRLEEDYPDKIFKYAETGQEGGGRFSPHKTHQNGLSVDFMTPVVDKRGHSKTLPTHALNRYGYDIEFDSKGHVEGFSIDYEALAAHIVALDRVAKSRGYGLWRVIFDPELQAPLFKTQFGSYLKQNITFTKKRSWVRHDEHYHVDFKVPCKKL